MGMAFASFTAFVLVFVSYIFVAVQVSIGQEKERETAEASMHRRTHWCP